MASRLLNSKTFNYCHQWIRGATLQQLSDYSVNLINRPGGVLKQGSACVYACRQEVDVCVFLGGSSSLTSQNHTVDTATETFWTGKYRIQALFSIVQKNAK